MNPRRETENKNTDMTETGDVGLAASAVGYLVTITLPNGATGFWGVVCDVLTLWGWGPVTSIGLAALFAVLVLTGALSSRFARAPRLLVVPLTTGAIVAAAPVLLVLVLVCAVLCGDNGEPSPARGDF